MRSDEKQTVRNSFSRRDFLKSGIGAALGLSVGSGILSEGCARKAEKASRNRPNIIFILADDLGYGDLGCYGQQVIQTPNLDRMASEGIRFTQAYAGSTVCAPSRCCLMTGFHTGHARIRGNALVPLEDEDVTVAEVLKAAGYTTAVIGKWGLGEPGTTGIPNRQGFDEWFGYLNQRHAHNYYPEYLWHNEEKVVIPENQGGKKGVYSHDLFAEKALEFIRRNRKGPFFLYLAFTLPHANNELGRETGNGMEVPSDEPYSDRPWPQPQKNHAAMITRLDRDVGRVLELLKELGIDDNTIVFFSSDNGPHKEGGADPAFFHSSGPLRGYKRDLYEGGIRVPMIVRWPGVVPAGVVSDHIWAFWDFLPTAAELAGGTSPRGIDGLSVADALKGQSAAEHEYLYWEFYERGFTQAVRKGDWKLIRFHREGRTELYNLAEDISESNDVSARYPDVVAELSSILEEAHQPSEIWHA